jgi:hypothetical protein
MHIMLCKSIDHLSSFWILVPRDIFIMNDYFSFIVLSAFTAPSIWLVELSCLLSQLLFSILFCNLNIFKYERVYKSLSKLRTFVIHYIIFCIFFLLQRFKTMALSKNTGSFCFKENMSFSNVIENHVLGTKYVKKKNSSTTVQQSQHYSKTSSLWGLITKETFTRTPVEGEHDSESDSEEEDIKTSSSGVLYRQRVQLCYSSSFKLK